MQRAGSGIASEATTESRLCAPPDSKNASANSGPRAASTNAKMVRSWSMGWCPPEPAVSLKKAVMRESIIGPTSGPRASTWGWEEEGEDTKGSSKREREEGETREDEVDEEEEEEVMVVVVVVVVDVVVGEQGSPRLALVPGVTAVAATVAAAAAVTGLKPASVDGGERVNSAEDGAAAYALRVRSRMCAGRSSGTEEER